MKEKKYLKKKKKKKKKQKKQKKISPRMDLPACIPPREDDSM